MTNSYKKEQAESRQKVKAHKLLWDSTAGPCNLKVRKMKRELNGYNMITVYKQNAWDSLAATKK